MDNEIWKPIKGYEGLYEISNFGRVKRLPKWTRATYPFLLKEKIMSLSHDKNGYAVLILTNAEGHKKMEKVHRLVAIAFIDNVFNYDQVNHKNEIKDDNCVSNLEWCDAKYNSNYGTRLKRISLARIGRTLTEGEKLAHRKASKPIVAISLLDSTIKVYCSSYDAQKDGFLRSNIRRCCQKRFNKPNNNIYKGFRWYFKDQWDALTPEEQERQITC